MNTPTSRLRLLIVINVAATILHYVDNVLFFEDYPEPPWLRPHMIDAFWFVMTPFALTGYLLVKRGFLHLGSAALYAYAGMSLLSLGHYLYAPIGSIGFRINAFIWLEAGLAAILIAYVAQFQIRRTGQPLPAAMST